MIIIFHALFTLLPSKPDNWRDSNRLLGLHPTTGRPLGGSTDSTAFARPATGLFHPTGYWDFTKLLGVHPTTGNFFKLLGLRLTTHDQWACTRGLGLLQTSRLSCNSWGLTRLLQLAFARRNTGPSPDWPLGLHPTTGHSQAAGDPPDTDNRNITERISCK